MDTWTSAEALLLRRLLIDSKSFSQIGLALHRSRNSIAGRVDRNPELQKLVDPKRRLVKKKPSIVPALKVRPATQLPNAACIVYRVKTMPKPEPVLELERPSPRRLVPMVELRTGECRWPIHEDHHVTGHFLFCGAKAVGSYCGHHARISEPD